MSGVHLPASQDGHDMTVDDTIRGCLSVKKGWPDETLTDYP
jgi:hypothetical protein